MCRRRRRRSSMVNNVARKIVSCFCFCFCFSTKQDTTFPIHQDTTTNVLTSMPTSKNLCAICLEPLNYSTSINIDSNIDNNTNQSIFTAQCSHAFHLICISSNVRHGSVTCPICRAHWTQLPARHNTALTRLNHNDPVLRILDHSIATFRLHRQSFLRSITPHRHRLQFSLPYHNSAYLSVKMEPHHPIDLVLVASPVEPPLFGLLKQLMSLTLFSLRSIDRLSIVACSSAPAGSPCLFPLRRMTPYGKRAALQIIHTLFCTDQADPFEGIRKGFKVLEERVHQNPRSCILHISDSNTRHYRATDMEMHIPVHRFDVGFRSGTSSGLVMHEFEDFLGRMLGNVIRETQLWIRDQDGRMIVRLGEMKNGEERRIALNMNMQCEGSRHNVYVGYSYVDGGLDDCNIVTGEALVRVQEKTDTIRADDHPEVTGNIRGRTSNCENWDCHDPYMARRWAKHLHGYRF